MAKRDRTHKSPAEHQLANSPFKCLKGLSVSDQEKRARDSSGPVSAPQEPEVVRETDERSFVEEMEWLGVRAIERQTGAGNPDKNRSAPSQGKGRGSRHERDERERQEFLKAVGKLDRNVEDAWQEPEAVLPETQARATPRRMRLLEKGRLQPEAELDLHGQTRDEAMRRLQHFLENAVHHGYQAVLVITGKGCHSPEGPVLREAAEQLLSQSRERVVEWGLAPRRYGGSGALVVFIRRRVDDDEGI